MSELFRNVLNASFYGSILIAVALVLRLVLRKVPKKYICLLWLLAAVRLWMPFEIESRFSLQPDVQPVTEIQWQQLEDYGRILPGTMQTDSSEANRPTLPVEETPVVNSAIQAVPDTDVQVEVKYEIIWAKVVPYLWLAVAVGLLGYSAVAYLRLRRRVGDAVVFSEGVWVSGRIESPFVMGFLRPRIFLNAGLREEDRAYVLAHERCHIRRLDHWWKWLGYITLAVHWFNPLVWVSYVLLCRDLEMACDEAVVKGMDLGERKAYSAALLSCSTRSWSIAACPVAFGEVSVKQRIKGVLNYRKPKFWIILTAFVAIVVVAACFLTNPGQTEELPDMEPAEADDWGISVSVENVSPTGLTFRFDRSGNSEELWYGQEYSIDRWTGSEWKAVENINENAVFTAEAILLPEEGVDLDISWEWLYGQLSEGCYRISKKLYGFSAEDSVGIRLYYAYFVIDEETGNDGNSDTTEEFDVAGKTFTYEKDGFGSAFNIALYQDHTFTYYEGLLSSYIGMGNWTLDGDTLILMDEGMGEKIRRYYFQVTEDALIFLAEKSSNFIYMNVADGDRFCLSGEVSQQVLTNETVVNMCAAAYTELCDAERFWILASTASNPYPFGIYQYVDGENYFIDALTERGYNTLKYNGTVYFHVYQDYMENKSIPTGWMTDSWVREHYGIALDGTIETFPWETMDWDALGLELDHWEWQNGGMVAQFAEKADPEHVWVFTLDGKGDLESITSSPDGAMETQWTIRGINGVYIDEIPLQYAEACRSIPDAVIVRDQAFYEELFTRRTDGHFTTDWIGDLYEAFYAEPEDFVNQLARKYSEDQERALEVIEIMRSESQYYAPKRLEQVLEQLRNDPEVDQNMVALLRQ